MFCGSVNIGEDPNIEGRTNMVFIFCDVSKLLSFSEEKSIIKLTKINPQFIQFIHFVLLLESVLEKLMLASSFITIV